MFLEPAMGTRKRVELDEVEGILYSNAFLEAFLQFSCIHGRRLGHGDTPESVYRHFFSGLVWVEVERTRYMGWALLGPPAYVTS